MAFRIQARVARFAVPFLLFLSATTSWGQDIDPGTPTTPTTPTVDSGQGGTSATSSGGDGSFDPDFTNVDIDISDDTRNQGFVGATSASIQEYGFAGVASESSGPPLVEGASFGGGVNSTGGGGGGRAGGATAARGQGFGAAGQLGFPVTRRNLRSRLRVSFAAPKVPSEQISNRFNNQFYRLPEANNFSGQFQISIANRKATITGKVSSLADSQRLIRQLRLEPGVYAIDNQLEIVN